MRFNGQNDHKSNDNSWLLHKINVEFSHIALVLFPRILFQVLHPAAVNWIIQCKSLERAFLLLRFHLSIKTAAAELIHLGKYKYFMTNTRNFRRVIILE